VTRDKTAAILTALTWASPSAWAVAGGPVAFPDGAKFLCRGATAASGAGGHPVADAAIAGPVIGATVGIWLLVLAMALRHYRRSLHKRRHDLPTEMHLSRCDATSKTPG